MNNQLVKRILVNLTFLLFTLGLHGQDSPLSDLNSANDAYQSNNFKQAIGIYEGLLSNGFKSKNIYYNLGNAYYRDSQLGQAVLNYERALLIAPGDKDVEHNLAVVNKQLKDEIEAISEFFLYEWWHQMRSWMTSAGWSWLALIFLWAGIGGFVLWLLAPLRNRKKQGFIAGIVLILLSILPFSLASSRKAYEEGSGTAIILQNEVVLHSAPDEASTAIITLHEGTKVGLLDSIGEWEKIRLQDGEVGWLRKKGIEEI